MRIYIVLIILLLCLPHITFSYIPVSPSKIIKEMYVGDTGIEKITVYNTHNKNATFTIKVDGKYTNFLMWDTSLILPRYEKGLLSISFFPKKIGNYNYRIFIQSDDIKDNATVIINLTVHPYMGVSVTNYSLFVKDENVIVEFVVNSKYLKNVNATLILMDEGYREIERKFLKLNVSGNKSVRESFNISDFLAGMYIVKLDMSYYRIEEIRRFGIEAKHNVIERRVIEKTNVREYVNISLENRGNVIEDYILKEIFWKKWYMPLFSINYSLKPESINIRGDEIEMNWFIRNFKPGDKIKISYSIDYTNSFLLFLSLIVTFLSISYISFRILSLPSIRKSIVKKGKKYLVTLIVKGPYIGSIKNSKLLDFIPLVVGIRMGRPNGTLKRGKDANIIEWDIGSISNGEERIFHYTLIPKIETEFELKNAILEFKKGIKKRRVYSKRVHVTFD